MSTPLFLTSPLPWAVLLLVILALAWRSLPRLLRRAGVALEVLLVLLMTPLGAALLARAVEARLPPPSCASPVPRTVVVLGAGFQRTPTMPTDFAALQPLGLHRVFTAVDLWRVLPGARLVVSGGGGHGIPEAVPMATLAQRLGVPASAIVVEGNSMDTWGNAREVAALRPTVPRHVWLVTSALHMPRALAAFRAFGFTPCAWPSDGHATDIRFRPQLLVPGAASVDLSARALHELVGGADYAWLAWRQRRAAARPHTP